ncbi:MAG TPA: EamA family transporter [Actinomycetota bacterium]|jgi:drug/metabolite transporter (DMT)-like permease|nr:EamA family transporter [Actinomycetota bacterium]
MRDGDGGPGRPEVGTLAAFIVLVVAAGGNAPAIRYVSCGSCELDPFWGAAMRFLLAGLILAGIALGLRSGMPRGRALLGSVLFGALQFGAGFGLVYWGFVRAPAGLGQVLLALVPLLTFALALAQRQETFRWEGLAGALLSVAGIAVVFVSGRDAGVPIASMVAIVAGALCWAEAFVVVRGFPRVHPAVQNAVGMAVGAMVLLVLAVIFDEPLAVPVAARTWWAQAYLVLAGSVGVFWLYVFVLRRWTASVASYQMVLIPLVTVPVSAWLQDERVSVSFVLGSALVLAGVYLGTRRPSPGRAPREIAAEVGEGDGVA